MLDEKLRVSYDEFSGLHTFIKHSNNKSSLLQAIQNGSVKLPKDDALPVNGVIAPYVFVSDDAFALKKFMMKPYPQQNLTGDKRVCNYRHSRARRI